MKRTLLFSLFGFLVVVPVAIRADEPPELQLEFVRKLRTNRMSDLALQYLEKLQAKASPKLAGLLPLEIARTRVSLARETATSKRMELLVEARKGLADYVAKNKIKPETAQVRLEMARVTYYEAQAILSKAFREEVKEARIQVAEQAKKKFDEAKIEFQSAMSGIETLMKKYSNANKEQEKFFKKQLAKDLLQAKFDFAKIHLDEAGTYFDTSKTAVRLERTKLIEVARTKLAEVALDYDKARTNPEVSFLSIAWLMRANQLLDNNDASKKLYQKLMEYRSVLPGEAAESVRWAVYFYIQGMYDDPSPPPAPYSKMPKVKYIQMLCEQWLQSFPTHKDTAVGQGMRYELASSHLSQAMAISKDYTDPKAKPHYDKSLKLFTKIADSDSDLAERANQKIFPLKMKMIGRNTKITELRDFESCVIKARFEMSELGKILAKLDSAKIKSQRDELAKEKKKQFQTILAAFDRALNLATLNTAPHKIDDVRYFMAYMYLLAGDNYRAAVMGEYLARRDPPTKRSPLAASYAIQAYKSVMAAQNLEANRRRLRELANFVINKRGQEWKDNQVVPMATYQLAMVAMREKKFDETLKLLAKLPKDFGAYTFAQAQLALTALNAEQKANEAKQFKQAEAYRRQALAAMRNITELPKNPDPATSQMFFVVQIEHGKIMYSIASEARKKGDSKTALSEYQKMAKFTDSLNKQFEKTKSQFGNEAQTAIGNSLNALTMYARLGFGEMEYLAGNFDKVLAKDLTGETVDYITGLGKKNKNIAVKDFQVAGQLVGLAMRAHVQKGNIKKAEEILNLLQRLEGIGGELSDPTLPLKKLIADLNIQVKNLEASKDKAKLKTFTQNFTKFFDALLKNKGAGNLDRNTVFFLARSYQILDQYDRAADLYGKIPQPPGFDPKKPLAPEEIQEKKRREQLAKTLFGQQIQKDLADPKIRLSVDEQLKLDEMMGKVSKEFAKWRQQENTKEIQLWWLLQVYRAEALRKAKKLVEAETLLNKVLKAKDGAGKLRAQKELNHVLEDRGHYGRAITAWSNYLGSNVLRSQIRSDPRLKETYFQCYYRFIWCWYQYSQTGGKKSEEKYLKRAADYILRLENAKNNEGFLLIEEKVRALLKEAPALNRVYMQMKQEAKAGAG